MHRVAATLVLVLLTLVNTSHLPLDPRSATGGKIWAVLAAPSGSYYNYGLQANINHAYQLLKGHGIPDERIIVMMPDDIAFDDDNPEPGVIINRPHGPNVYPGVPKDFIGKDVTPENFLKILTGGADLKQSGKKVLESTEKDHVFVVVSDHGLQGGILFPDSILKATQLLAAVKKMRDEKMFDQLVFYFESCYSGSMFHGLLPSDWNVYAATAANHNEVAYFTYYDAYRQTYLGAHFSVSWLEDSDSYEDLEEETISEQFKLIKRLVDDSHVSQYGDERIVKDPLSLFQGQKKREKDESQYVRSQDYWKDNIAIPDARFLLTQRKALTSNSSRNAYEELVSARMYFDEWIGRFVDELSQAFVLKKDSLMDKRFQTISHSCYEQLLDSFDQKCYHLTQHRYAIRYLHILINACHETSGRRSSHHLTPMMERFIGNYCDYHVNHSFEAIV